MLLCAGGLISKSKTRDAEEENNVVSERADEEVSSHSFIYLNFEIFDGGGRVVLRIGITTRNFHNIIAS